MEGHGAGFPSENTHTWEPVWSVSAKKTRGPLPLAFGPPEQWGAYLSRDGRGLTYAVGSCGNLRLVEVGNIYSREETPCPFCPGQELGVPAFPVPRQGPGTQPSRYHPPQPLCVVVTRLCKASGIEGSVP